MRLFKLQPYLSYKQKYCLDMKVNSLRRKYINGSQFNRHTVTLADETFIAWAKVNRYYPYLHCRLKSFHQWLAVIDDKKRLYHQRIGIGLTMIAYLKWASMFKDEKEQKLIERISNEWQKFLKENKQEDTLEFYATLRAFHII